MKKIKVLYRTINYLGSDIGRTLRSSLAHTFRIEGESATVKTQILKWDSELVDGNKVYFGDSFLKELGVPINEIVSFGDVYSTGMNVKIVKGIVRHFTKASDSNERNRELATAKFSLKKACLALPVQYHGYVLGALKKYLNGEKTYQSFERELKDLKLSCDIDLIATRLSIYEAAKSRITTPSQKCTIVQEGILTFPLKDPVTEGFTHLSGELTINDVINVMNQFLSYFFPEYPVIAIVGHVDEERMHVHYFIDGWCRGLAKETIPQKVIKIFHANDNSTAVSVSQLKSSDLVEVGKKLQRAFYAFINMELLNKKGLVAEISPEHERISGAAKQRDLDSKKPIDMREYQRCNEKIRQSKLLAEALEKETALMIKEMNEIQNKLNAERKKSEELGATIREQLNIVNQFYLEEMKYFVNELSSALKLAPEYANSADTEQLVQILIDKYPMLSRDFWRDMLIVGIAGNTANNLLQQSLNKPDIRDNG